MHVGPLLCRENTGYVSYLHVATDLPHVPPKHKGGHTITVGFTRLLLPPLLNSFVTKTRYSRIFIGRSTTHESVTVVMLGNQRYTVSLRGHEAIHFSRHTDEQLKYRLTARSDRTARQDHCTGTAPLDTPCATFPCTWHRAVHLRTTSCWLATVHSCDTAAWTAAHIFLWEHMTLHPRRAFFFKFPFSSAVLVFQPPSPVSFVGMRQ